MDNSNVLVLVLVLGEVIYGGLTSGILELPGTISNLRLNSANKNSSRLNNQNIQEINSENNINNFDVFTKQVDKVIKGTWDTNNHLTVLEHTPQVLQQFGVKDYPILLTANKLKRIMNVSGNQKGEYHGLGELVKKIPSAIENPLDIVKSHNNSYVLTADLSDNNDRSIIVSIKIDGKGYINDIEVDANIMTSAYGRNNYDSWMANHQKNGNIVYDIDRGFINKKKLDAIPRLQLPSNNIKFSDDNIPQIDRNVKNGTSSNNINIQNNENNTQRTTNGSFSFDKTARRYDDLQQATRIDYTATSDGDINTIMYDKDGNLINQIVLYDKNMANKEYGSQIGDYLFSNSSKQWQTINLNNSNETTNNTNNEISQDLVKEIEYKTRENNKNNSNVEYIPVYTLLNAKKNGGYRTPEQVQNLTDNIKTNGISSPIELVRDSNGNIVIENGNHRLEIAQNLGLEEVPVIYSNSSLENFDNNSYNKNNISEVVKGENNGRNENVKIIGENNAQIQNIERNSFDNSQELNNKRTATGNDRLYQQMVGYNNRPSSNTTRSQNSVQSEAKGLDNTMSLT